MQSPTFAYKLKREFSSGQIIGELTVAYTFGVLFYLLVTEIKMARRN